MALGSSGIERHHVSQQELHGPTVGGAVVHSEEEDVFGETETQQPGPKQGALCEVERSLHEAGGETVRMPLAL